MFGKEKEGVLSLPKSTGTKIKAGELPSSTWDFGCSAGTAGEIAAFYDKHEYPNIYTGPTNGDVMPLDENPWPVFTDSSAANPLITSMKGVDGRTDIGSIDDYWGPYNSSEPNPYTGSGEGGQVPL
jgi:hypothetical protein